MAATDVGAVLADCRRLLAAAGSERAKRLLRREIQNLENEHRATLSAPAGVGERVPAQGDHRIATYAWDQTPKAVKWARASNAMPGRRR